MSAQRNARPRFRPLPPHGKEIAAMVRQRLRPVIFGGAIVVSLDWRLGSGWPRIVLPPDVDPYSYNLDFLRGLDLLVVHRPGHPQDHLEMSVAAVKAAAPNVCAVVALPHLVDES